MRHLLLDHLNGQKDARQEVRYLQERVPPHVSVQVVPDQSPEHMPAVSESDRLPGIALSGTYWTELRVCGLFRERTCIRERLGLLLGAYIAATVWLLSKSKREPARKRGRSRLWAKRRV